MFVSLISGTINKSNLRFALNSKLNNTNSTNVVCVIYVRFRLSVKFLGFMDKDILLTSFFLAANFNYTDYIKILHPVVYSYIEVELIYP